MGNRFEFTLIRKEKEQALAQEDLATCVAEVKRIEKMLTTFSEDSETAQVNAQAGIAPVKVSDEFFNLVLRAQKISSLTQGAFDLSYGGVDKSLWNFDKNMQALPSPEVLKAGVKLINYRHIILDENARTVFLKDKGMRLGFGGIGKGYAADKVKQLMQARGVASGIINASGDLTTWGVQENDKPWNIGIAHPDYAAMPMAKMEISGLAVATSGSYEKYVVINGKKYSHTIDPKIGLPISGIKSVSIITTSAELADAMATPVTIMGVEAGLDLINQMHGIACIIVTDDNKVYCSKQINTN